MRPVLLPLIERRTHAGLVRRGFAAKSAPTELGRVHYYEARGTGALPPALFLHGIGAASAGYAPVLGRLCAQLRGVTAVDHLGHGRSDDPAHGFTPERLLDAATAALDAIVREPVTLVGNSLGGYVAVEYAVRRPDRVRALVLLSPAGAPSTPRELDELRAAFALTSRRRALELIDRVHHRAPLLAHLVAHEAPAQLARRPAVRELLASITLDHGLAERDVAALAMPVLLWWGRSEKLLPPSHLAWWRRHLPPHAVVEEPHGIGHCPHLDDPARVASRIAAASRDAGAAVHPARVA
ncbi:MAG: alpha/beta fold hydrolase [Deltaproteobacteria bacterium]|nr:alpha/beta fold hydrolase [Deltaproteobacteria bacterium]